MNGWLIGAEVDAGPHIRNAHSNVRFVLGLTRDYHGHAEIERLGHGSIAAKCYQHIRVRQDFREVEEARSDRVGGQRAWNGLQGPASRSYQDQQILSLAERMDNRRHQLLEIAVCNGPLRNKNNLATGFLCLLEFWGYISGPFREKGSDEMEFLFNLAKWKLKTRHAGLQEQVTELADGLEQRRGQPSDTEFI